MASSSNSTASSLHNTTSPSHTYNLGSHGTFTLTVTNITHHVSLRLDRTNYLLWCSLFMPVLNSQSLLGFVNGLIASPTQHLPDSTASNPIPNPLYLTWYKIDQTIQSWILATLSPAALGQMLGLSTSQAMWTKLEKLYSPTSQSRILQLRFELQTIRRGTQSMSDYLDRIKNLSDSLAAAGSPVEPHELVYYTLGGLGSEYEPFIMSVIARTDVLPLEDLHHLLPTQEHRLNLNAQLASLDLDSSSPSAHVATRTGNSQSRGRGIAAPR